MKHYELVLPENYKMDKVIDAKSPKTGIIMNIASLIIMIIIFIIIQTLMQHKHHLPQNYKMEQKMYITLTALTVVYANEK